MKRSLWIILFLILIGCGSDRVDTERRGFDEVRIEKYNASERYNYDRVITRKPNPVLDFFGKILSAIAWFLNSIFGYLMLAILVGLLIYVLFKYVNTERQSFAENATGLRVVNEANVEHVDLDKLIAQALKKQDYRLAIRFRFLKALKSLSLSDVIKMKEGKTNYEYYYELPEELRLPYKNILSVFEYVWYGEFPANADLYQEVDGRGNELYSLINKDNA